jgi:hypothetical protein
MAEEARAQMNTAHPSRSPRRRQARALLALTAALAFVLALVGTASAAPGSGQVDVSLAGGKGEGSLAGQGVKLTYTAKAGKTGSAKRVAKKAPHSASLPVVDLDLTDGATVQTSGALRLLHGKRRATLRDLVVRSGGDRTAISAQLGKERLVVFRAQSAASIAGLTATLSDAQISLTGKAAAEIARRLGLEPLAGRQGTLELSAQGQLTPKVPDPIKPEEKPKGEEPEGEKLIDPYLGQCNVAAKTKAEGQIPDPAADPALTDSFETVAPTTLNWGFKGDFRGYIVGVAGGSLHALDGAVANGAPPVYSSFGFPVTDGEYADNDPIDMTDDQAVVESEGTALLCGTKHGFRIAISNPTVIVDGDDSRIVADVDANLSGTWIPTQSVHIADLNLDGITPFYNRSGSEVNWGSVPATLSDDGADAICGGDPNCVYGPGTALDPIGVAVKTPYDTGVGGADAASWNALANYVSTELPFPIPLATEGGCTLPAAAGGSNSTARTVDENLGYGGSATAWNADGAQPAPAPTLTGGTALTAGDFEWGVRRSLRATVNGTGEFNLFGGATASHPYKGNGGTGTPLMGNSKVEPAKFFRWASAGGTYKANGAGNADDQLVLRTAGRVAFCQLQSAQLYATILTDPRIVIDGSESRITVDVLTRYRLSWVRGRVDIAKLDLTDPGATVTENTASGTTTVEWKFAAANEDAVPAPTGPIDLTKAGEAVLNMIAPTTYKEGIPLDAAAIKVSFPAGP